MPYSFIEVTLNSRELQRLINRAKPLCIQSIRVTAIRQHHVDVSIRTRYKQQQFAKYWIDTFIREGRYDPTTE